MNKNKRANEFSMQSKGSWIVMTMKCFENSIPKRAEQQKELFGFRAQGTKLMITAHH
uniref:Uncharacterized protein n=1 Tax=Arundo donax TaxID=35708 RepID=A0A0A9DZE3_ARUDO